MVKHINTMKQLWLLWLFGGFVWTTNRQPRLPRCPELYRDMPCMYGYIRIYSPMSRNCISFSKILSPIVVQQWLTHRGSKISNRGSRISNPRPSKCYKPCQIIYLMTITRIQPLLIVTRMDPSCMIEVYSFNIETVLKHRSKRPVNWILYQIVETISHI